MIIETLKKNIVRVKIEDGIKEYFIHGTQVKQSEVRKCAQESTHRLVLNDGGLTFSLITSYSFILSYYIGQDLCLVQCEGKWERSGILGF